MCIHLCQQKKNGKMPRSWLPCSRWANHSSLSWLAASAGSQMLPLKLAGLEYTRAKCVRTSHNSRSSHNNTCACLIGPLCVPAIKQCNTSTPHATHMQCSSLFVLPPQKRVAHYRGTALVLCARQLSGLVSIPLKAIIADLFMSTYC